MRKAKYKGKNVEVIKRKIKKERESEIIRHRLFIKKLSTGIELVKYRVC